MRARSLILICVCALVGLVGCRTETPEADPEPTPEGFTPTSGEASLSVTGDVEAQLDMSLADDVRQRSAPADEASALSYVDADGNRLTIAGSLEEGENRTSDTLQVDVSLPGGVFMADDDQCVVTLHSLDDDSLEGEVGCADISDDGRRAVNVEGTFSASS